MKKTSAGIGLIALATCGLALAQQQTTVTPTDGTPGETSRKMHGSFGDMDKNRDGRLSMVETQESTELRSSFQSLDKNADGYLNQQEFGGWSGKDGKMEHGGATKSGERAPVVTSPNSSPANGSRAPTGNEVGSSNATKAPSTDSTAR